MRIPILIERAGFVVNAKPVAARELNEEGESLRVYRCEGGIESQASSAFTDERLKISGITETAIGAEGAEVGTDPFDPVAGTELAPVLGHAFDDNAVPVGHRVGGAARRVWIPDCMANGNGFEFYASSDCSRGDS